MHRKLTTEQANLGKQGRLLGTVKIVGNVSMPSHVIFF